MKPKWLRRVFAAAALATVTASGLALNYDATILIDKALSSPTLTIRYSGASAALAELRVNGDSFSTRSLNPGISNGETNFTLNLASLREGDNDIEIRLFDKDGKVVGTQKTTINASQAGNSPVFLSAPKMGATVQGPVEIKVGFGKELKNAYVSFFVDNQFKSMSNFAPFTFTWDSTRVANGWHELEAWVVGDDSETTLKTKKLRIFVNNPSGFTERRILKEPDHLKNAIASIKPMVREVPIVSSVATVAATHTAKVPLALTEVGNALKVKASGAMAALKTSPIASSIAASTQLMTPTGTRTAIESNAAPKVASQVTTTRVTKIGEPTLSGPIGKSVEPTTKVTVNGASKIAALPNPADYMPGQAGTAKMAIGSSTEAMVVAHPVLSEPTVKAEPAKHQGEIEINVVSKVAPVTKAIVSTVKVTPKVQPAVTKTTVAPKVSSAVKPVQKVTLNVSQAATSVAKVATTSVAKRKTVGRGFRLNVTGPLVIEMNNSIMHYDVDPMIVDGIPLGPIRYLIEQNGGKVEWESLSKTVRATSDGRQIEVQMGQKIAHINKLPVELEIEPFIHNSRAMIPLSFAKESLKVNVEYDERTGHVLITRAK